MISIAQPSPATLVARPYVGATVRHRHLLPLFVAMGAAGPDAQATQLHASVEHGVLAMDVYGFQ